MITGVLDIYFAPADISDQVLAAVNNVIGVVGAAFISGDADIRASITTANGANPRQDIQRIAGVYAVSELQV